MDSHKHLPITLHFIPFIIDLYLIHLCILHSKSFSKNKFWCIKESKGSSAVSQKSDKSCQALLRQNIISNNIHWVTKFHIIQGFLKCANMLNSICYYYRNQEMEYLITEPKSTKVFTIITYKYSGRELSNIP